MIEKADIEKGLKIGFYNALNKALAESGQITNEVNHVLEGRKDSSCKFPLSFRVSLAVDDKAKTVGVEASGVVTRENISLQVEPSCFPMDDPSQPELGIFDNTKALDGTDLDPDSED